MMGNDVTSPRGELERFMDEAFRASQLDDPEQNDNSQEPDQNPSSMGYGKRRKRIVYAGKDLQMLEESFANDPYPDSNVRENLATQLGVTEDRVQVWFQNRRSRARRKQKRYMPYCQIQPPRPYSTPPYSPAHPIAQHQNISPPSLMQQHDIPRSSPLIQQTQNISPPLLMPQHFSVTSPVAGPTITGYPSEYGTATAAPSPIVPHLQTRLSPNQTMMDHHRSLPSSSPCAVEQMQAAQRTTMSPSTCSYDNACQADYTGGLYVMSSTASCPNISYYQSGPQGVYGGSNGFSGVLSEDPWAGLNGTVDSCDLDELCKYVTPIGSQQEQALDMVQSY